jgi:hypothetical protein
LINIDREVKRDKTKAFKTNEETLQKINEIIKKSGKSEAEYFEELIQDISVRNLTESDETNISSDLRKHFSSDVAKLKNATHSIVQTFISQMENIAVEKNTWHKHLSQEIEKSTSIIASQKAQHDELSELYKALQDTHTITLKELDNIKKSAEMCEKWLNDQDELIQNQKNKIYELNQTIVDQASQLEKNKTLASDNKALEERVNKLTLDTDILKGKHKVETVNLEEQLTFETEKAILRRENELYDKFREQEKQIRETVRLETREEVRSFYQEEFKTRESELKIELKEHINKIVVLDREILQLKEQIDAKLEKPTSKRKVSTTKKTS